MEKRNYSRSTLFCLRVKASGTVIRCNIKLLSFLCKPAFLGSKDKYKIGCATRNSFSRHQSSAAEGKSYRSQTLQYLPRARGQVVPPAREEVNNQHPRPDLSRFETRRLHRAHWKCSKRDATTLPPLDEFLRGSWRVATAYTARNNKFYRRLHGIRGARVPHFVIPNRNPRFCRVVNVNGVTTKTRCYPSFSPFASARCLTFLLPRRRYMSATRPFFSRGRKSRYRDKGTSSCRARESLQDALHSGKMMEKVK